MGTERDDGIGEELQDQAVERLRPTEIIDGDEPRPWPAQAPWANTAVHGRYPAGTDPFLALKDAMGVFMERTDGSNGMGWWQLPPYRWWHAGPAGFRRGDSILPPVVTGMIPALASDPMSVYVTSDRSEAILYAAQHLMGDERSRRLPMLYEVIVESEPQPDDTQPTSTTSFRVPSARIRRIEQPSKRELSAAVQAIMDVNERAMMIEQGEKPCEPVDCSDE